MPTGTRRPTGSPRVGPQLIKCRQEARHCPLPHSSEQSTSQPASSGVLLSFPITRSLNWTSLYSSLRFSGWGEAKRVACLQARQNKSIPARAHGCKLGQHEDPTGSSSPGQPEQQLGHSSGFPLRCPRGNVPMPRIPLANPTAPNIWSSKALGHRKAGQYVRWAGRGTLNVRDTQHQHPLGAPLRHPQVGTGAWVTLRHRHRRATSSSPMDFQMQCPTPHIQGSVRLNNREGQSCRREEASVPRLSRLENDANIQGCHWCMSVPDAAPTWAFEAT